MSNSDRPFSKTRAETWRTVIAVVQLAVALATLIILVAVHFL